jgi:hypothetical protein
MRLFLIAALATLATGAQAERLVTNPQMCAFDDPMDAQEMGMTLDASSFWEIEYFCAFEPPIALDWGQERMQSRVGYCSEPGLVTPGVFTFQTSSYEPGTVHLWQQGVEQPTTFQACPGG